MLQNEIPMNDCNHGYLYKISARNSSIGIWNKYRKVFIIPRFKFGSHYLFEEFHWDCGPPFGTAIALEELMECPFHIPDDYIEDPDNEILNYLLKKQKDIYNASR